MWGQISTKLCSFLFLLAIFPICTTTTPAIVSCLRADVDRLCAQTKCVFASTGSTSLNVSLSTSTHALQDLPRRLIAAPGRIRKVGGSRIASNLSVGHKTKYGLHSSGGNEGWLNPFISSQPQEVIKTTSTPQSFCLSVLHSNIGCDTASRPHRKTRRC